ncbi:hypothetical protein [Breoghania sp.]|uniref:hypothetical protein n=1 Tax=Breoghania sp. TaxID=2065378 RepID=UPI002631D112|nr:hypothetical protein [Breoghania sp.]MDJ0930804.1 hypothetical protein [Breoghania sp.]
MEAKETMMGRGRDAIDMIVDADSFKEGTVGAKTFDDPEFGPPGAVVGTAALEGKDVTIIASDAQAFNEKFPVVYAGIIGMEGRVQDGSGRLRLSCCRRRQAG